MADIGLAAFSLFFLQSPSFLAHQRRLEAGQGRSNCQTLFGLDRVPSDNHIRALLDPVSPDHFHPVFTEVVAELEGSGGLEPFRLPSKLPRSTGSIATQFQSHLELLVTGGSCPPPVPTERGVRFSRTTLFDRWFTALRGPAAFRKEVAVLDAATDISP
jgi:hypothetical protein